MDKLLGIPVISLVVSAVALVSINLQSAKIIQSKIFATYTGRNSDLASQRLERGPVPLLIKTPLLTRRILLLVLNHQSQTQPIYMELVLSIKTQWLNTIHIGYAVVAKLPTHLVKLLTNGLDFSQYMILFLTLTLRIKNQCRQLIITLCLLLTC